MIPKSWVRHWFPSSLCMWLGVWTRCGEYYWKLKMEKLNSSSHIQHLNIITHIRLHIDRLPSSIICAKLPFDWCHLWNWTGSFFLTCLKRARVKLHLWGLKITKVKPTLLKLKEEAPVVLKGSPVCAQRDRKCSVQAKHLKWRSFISLNKQLYFLCVRDSREDNL